MNKSWLKNIDEHIGQQLRKIRLLREHTQKTVGNGVGLTYQQIQKYERSQDGISVARLYQIACFMQVDPRIFFDGLPGTKEEPLPYLTKEHIKILRYYDSLSEQGRKDIMKLMKIIAE